MDAKELGRRGERQAAWFYRRRGFWIIGRNVRFGHGEIDLIAKRGKLLVFVEVKTRQTLTAGEGFESVDGRKQKQLIDLASRYLMRNRHEGEIRYDVLSLFWNGLYFQVRHFPNAFEPMYDGQAKMQPF